MVQLSIPMQFMLLVIKSDVSPRRTRIMVVAIRFGSVVLMGIGLTCRQY